MKKKKKKKKRTNALSRSTKMYLTGIRNITISLRNLPQPSELQHDDSPLKKLLLRIQHSHLKYKKELDIWSKQELQDIIDNLSKNQIKIWGPYINKWTRTHTDQWTTIYIADGTSGQRMTKKTL